MPLDKKIEAILFFKAEPQSVNELASLTKAEKNEVEEALGVLEKKLEGRGVVLVRNGDTVELRTAPDTSELIENLQKEALSKDLGKAGSETLSIILYRGPMTRSEIDYIRGVNSTFILRNLLIRGLIEKVLNPKDGRSYLYKPTIELLSFLGISRIEELPEFETVSHELDSFEKQEHSIEEKNDGGE